MESKLLSHAELNRIKDVLSGSDSPWALSRIITLSMALDKALKRVDQLEHIMEQANADALKKTKRSSAHKLDLESQLRRAIKQAVRPLKPRL